MNRITEISELVKKNLRELLRSKIGSLIVILGPLLIIFLAGLAFDNSSIYSVKIGTFGPDNPTTASLTEKLEEQFSVIEYDTEESCINAIKNTDVNTCLVFNQNFTIGKPSRNDITFHVDYSRLNLVWTITSVLSERIGEEATSSSEDLTRVLLETLDYTQERIEDQRQAVVKLTTENELILQNTQDLVAELGDINLQFDDDRLPLENLTRANTQVKQWVDNALSLGTKGLNKAESYIDAAYDLAAGSGGNQQLLESFQKTVDDIDKLQADLSTTKEVTQQSFETFSDELAALTIGITNTKEQLATAETSRQLSLRVLEALENLLDKSLLSVFLVQESLNDIDAKIDDIAITDAEAIAQPIVTNIKPIVQETTYLNYLFPVLIVLVIMFTALLITPTLILLEKHSPAHFRTYMTPVRDSSYLIATFVTSSIILLLQVFIILSIASIFFTDHVVSSAFEALLALLIVNSLFILIGMIVGYAFNSEETATLAGVSVGAIFLFISDVIIPIESMPQAFNYIAGFNPYVISSSILRRVLLFDASLLSLLDSILLLFGYIIAFGLIASGTFLLTRNYSFEKLMKRIMPTVRRMRIPNPFKKKH